MWKIVHLCPVLKKQDKSNLANYHSFSLPMIISKVMEDDQQCYKLALD